MQFKIITSLEKCFLDESIDSKSEYLSGSCLKNEMFHFGLAYSNADEERTEYVYLSVESPIKDYIEIKKVERVPVQFAAKDDCKDDGYLRTQPGLYPDFLQALPSNGRLAVSVYLKSLFIEVNLKGEVEAGVYPITFCFTENTKEAKKHRVTFSLEVIDAMLPEQETIVTQWFHCDCLMNYYGTECFSEEHWRIIENFMKTAVKYGMNMILTPVFTPPLDTPLKGERPTVQLVDVTYKNGKYTFGFERLDRWINLALSLGIKYFEISHLFTQWGVRSAPKIIAETEKGVERIFGWENASDSKEYVEFLDAFLSSLMAHFKNTGIADKVYFHISDEPKLRDLDYYRTAYKNISKWTENRPIIDALSNYEFYKEGICPNPIPATDAIEPFIENNVKNLWCYYCEAQGKDVSNRFIALPSYRNRIIGVQMYKYDIKGFLHYGYNYYYNRYSYEPINPYLVTDGDMYVPAGDCFAVYPSRDGEALISLRHAVFYDALQDMRAFSLCESLCGREAVMKLIDEDITITFKKYPRSADYILNLRERINQIIKTSITEDK